MKSLMAIVYLSFIWHIHATSQIIGQIENHTKGSVMYLSLINSEDEFDKHSMDMVIKNSPIDNDGYFSFSLKDLPKSYHFYRLTLMSTSNGSIGVINAKDRKNYQGLLLNSKSDIHIRLKNSNFLSAEIQSSNPINSQIIDFNRKYFPNAYNINNRASSSASISLAKANLANLLNEIMESTSSIWLKYYAFILSKKYVDSAEESYIPLLLKNMDKEIPNSIYTNELKDSNDSFLGNDRKKSWNTIIIFLLLLCNICLILIVINQTKKLKSHRVCLTKNQDQLNKKMDSLTERELLILEALSLGKSNKEIAQEIFIEVSTVKTHLSNIFHKLEVTNRMEAKELFLSLKK